MLTRTQEEILAFLLNNQDEQLSIRGLAKKLGKSYTLVYNNILDLQKKELITKRTVEPAKIISLNEFAPSEILVNIELKKKDAFLEKHIWIRLLLEDILTGSDNLFFIILVFGSYAKGTQTQNSDLDILLIVQDKKQLPQIENAVNKAYSKVKKSLHIIEIDDFKEMISQEKALNIGNSARKNHVILYGAEQYYLLLKKAYSR